MRFAKTQACGNDFLIVEDALDQELAKETLRTPHRPRR